MTTKTSKTGRIETTKRLRDVPLSAMKINPTAQRELSQSWHDWLVANFDLDKMGVPTVNHRDGSYHVVDGQHTIEALRTLGFGDASVQCWVYEGLDEQAEADLFLTLNNRRTIKTFDRFEIGVVAEREVPSDIDRIVRALGLNISKGKQPGSIGAVGTLEKVYRRGGPAVFSRALRWIRDGFGADAFDAPLIDGVGLVCQRFNGEIKDDQAVAKFRAVRAGSSGLLGKARLKQKQFNQPLNQCVADAIVETLNAGRGGQKLPSWWKS